MPGACMVSESHRMHPRGSVAASCGQPRSISFSVWAKPSFLTVASSDVKFRESMRRRRQSRRHACCFYSVGQQEQIKQARQTVGQTPAGMVIVNFLTMDSRVRAMTEMMSRVSRK